MKKLRQGEPVFKKPTRRSWDIFVKVLLGVMLLTVLFVVVNLSTGSSVMRLYEGDISLKDIYAPYDFTYTGEMDAAKMEAAKKKALENLYPVYSLNKQIEEAVKNTVTSFFSEVSRGGSSSSLNLSNNTYAYLQGFDNISAVETKTVAIINQSLKKGILNEGDKESLLESGVGSVVLLDASTAIKTEEQVASIPTLDGFKKEAEKSVVVHFPKDKKLRAAVSEIVKTVMASNLEYDPEATDKEKEERIAALPKIYKKVAVKKNEILIEKGEKVTKKHLDMLAQLGKMSDLGGRFFYLLGMALLLIIFLAVASLHLRLYEREIFRSSKNLLLMCLLVLLVAVIAESVVVSPLSSYLIPLASVSMLLAILLDANSAFIFTIVISIFIGIIAGNNFGLMIVMFIGSSVGIYSVRKVRKRSELLLAGFLVGVANLFTITALNLLNNIDRSLFIGEGLLGMVNGVISFLLVIGLLPILEYLFKIPTDISLLELSDLNHPLLKSMATNASGTYHHSLIVGNLAEAACEAIGANSLLARVGAYYHDIGKIGKAEYFSENVSEPKNSRHEGLTPSMSALVIINHVKDGIESARKYKLNQSLIDFIAQHHGNGLIYYFYQRALEKVDTDENLEEQEFRYPGPKPQSKEAAIVLLADSVEASSRTLANPNPSRIQALVQKIINNKFIDGQLDECNLTLKDLHKISEAFTRILNAMFHTRVEYPEEEELKRLKDAKNNHKKSDQKKAANGKNDKGPGKEGP
ncbi:MAG: HDIG domain-containing protein [Candidatus Omnitrophica bacterium]|nr:HDIG domain-containing protein [Candidatus Omnitrophota bacterium]